MGHRRRRDSRDGDASALTDPKNYTPPPTARNDADGNSVGPFLERIPETAETFDFVEPAVGETNVPLREFDPESVRTRCAEAGLDLAAAAGADRAVAHCTANRGSRDDLDLFRQNVRRLAAAGRDRGIEIVFENLGRLDRGCDLDTVGRVLDDCDAACCFDVGHAFEEGGQAAFESFSPDLERCVHSADRLRAAFDE